MSREIYHIYGIIINYLSPYKVSVRLSEQMLTSGAGIPILVHKCLEFIETHGE